MTTAKKWSFYWVITWKLLFSGGNEPLVGGSLLGGIFSWWEVWADFWLVGLTPPHPPVGKTLSSEGVGERETNEGLPGRIDWGVGRNSSPM